MKKLSKSSTSIYIVSFVANILFLYFIYSQVSGVKTLSSLWNEAATHNLNAATQLAEVERSFGYVGFIHHFKNYVIRGSDEYYQRALESYASTKKSIASLKYLSTEEEQQTISVIEMTLDEYYKKLVDAKHNHINLPINQLDELVKVDDSAADKALNELRINLLPSLKKQQLITNEKVNALNKRTIFVTALLLPIFIFSNILTIRLIRRLTSVAEELATIFDSSPDAILYVADNGKILKANKVAEPLFGYSVDELCQLTIEKLIPENLHKEHILLRQEFVKRVQSKEMSNRNSRIQGVRKDGSLVDLHVSIASNEYRGKMRTVCIAKDVTQYNRLKQEALTDHLTGLYNRRAFDEVLKKELARTNRGKKNLSLLMIDLDHFKTLNDTLGHIEGDEALKDVAYFLKKHSREYDHLARWGGDEFILLCPELSIDDAFKNAERIRSDFEQAVADWPVKLTLSIGVATTKTGDDEHAQLLLDRADEAVYAAKENGKNQVKHYDYL